MLALKSCLRYLLRNSKLHARVYNEINASEKYSRKEIGEYQNEKLRNIIKIAYDGVPYYRDLFKSLLLKPKDIRTKDDLHKIPALDKKTVQSNSRLFVNRFYKGYWFKGYTSGTTGTPGVFLRDLRSIIYEALFLQRQYRWAGKNPDSLRVVLRGDIVVPVTRNKPPFWKYDPINKELVMSSWHLSEENMRSYIDIIEKCKPGDMYAYPSTACFLASHIEANSRKIVIGLLFTSSETLSDQQKCLLKNNYGSKIFDLYGNAERTVQICHCENGVYHELEDYSIVEYEKAGDGCFTMLGTTMNNHLMPLIRYRIDDIVTFDNTNKCGCGREFRVINSIEGRMEDVVILPNGRKIGRLDHIFKGLDFVSEAQMIQTDKNILKIYFVPSAKYESSDDDALLEKAEHYMGKGSIYIEVIKTKKIPREKSGKLKFVKNVSSP